MAQSGGPGRQVFFSCRTAGGFTSEILQLSTFYKLGRSLGFDYVHTPLTGRRSSDSVHEFLGIDRFFTRIATDISPREAFEDIDLGLQALDQPIATLSELQNYIREKISVLARDKISGAIRIRFTLKGNKRVKRIPAQGQGNKTVFQIVNTDATIVPDRINMRAIYFDTRRKQPWRSRFQDGKINLLVHIRQGDTAVIETPWNTFIPVWDVKKIREAKTLSETGNRQISVGSYFPLIKNLAERFGVDGLSTVICSDGFSRAFDRLNSRLGLLELNREKTGALLNSRKSYDARAFSIFNKLKNCTCLVGENDQNLFDLIHSGLTADIIVFGTQQRLMPKLLALFGDRDNPPVLVQVHRTSEPVKQKAVGVDPKKFNIISFRADGSNMDSAFAEIALELKRRRGPILDVRL